MGKPAQPRHDGEGRSIKNNSSTAEIEISPGRGRITATLQTLATALLSAVCAYILTADAGFPGGSLAPVWSALLVGVIAGTVEHCDWTIEAVVVTTAGATVGTVFLLV